MILLNGFQKKSQKTPKKEIDKALQLMSEHYEGKNEKTVITPWSEIKDRVYGSKGTDRRDNLEREAESFRIGLMLKKARESRQLTQQELGQIIDKKRTYISKVENDGGNITLKTLFDIVEKGLGGKVKISIEV